MSKPLIEQQIAAHFSMTAGMVENLPVIQEIADVVWQSFTSGGHLYAFGNGGSAAEAQHFAGELIGHYAHDRDPLPAIALGSDIAVVSCIANDYSYEDVYARQVKALAKPNDVVVGFSTSGTSPNVVAALAQGRTNGATTVLFTGDAAKHPPEVADLIFKSPNSATARIQEMHQLAMHIISEIIDERAIEV